MGEKKKKSKGVSRETVKDEHAALMILVSFLLPITLYRFSFLRILSCNCHSLCLCTDYSAKIKFLGFDNCILRHIEVVRTLVIDSPYCKTVWSCASSNHICNCIPYIALESHKPILFYIVCRSKVLVLKGSLLNGAVWS